MLKQYAIAVTIRANQAKWDWLKAKKRERTDKFQSEGK